MLQISTAKKENIKPEGDFKHPLVLLSDCHRRIEKFLEQIIGVCEAARDGVLPETQREALKVALRYFQKAAPLHTADEEESLFPRLRERAEAGDATAQRALAVMAQLEADHDAADIQHAAIDEIGARWLEQSTLPAAEVAHLEAEARSLRKFYEAHIALEDNELFPLAGAVLASNAVENVGREMAARRGLDFDNLPAGSLCAARKAAQSVA
jgi:hemerythrin-like domain-containing protein